MVAPKDQHGRPAERHRDAYVSTCTGDFVDQLRSQRGPGPRLDRPFDLAGARQHSPTPTLLGG
jgi:hypothetical protein